MNDRSNSSARNPPTPAKTPSKTRSKTSLTVQKYINAKLEYSEKKKQTIDKILGSKEDRIRQLESQIVENQLLVKETLEKWQDYKKDVEREKGRELGELERQVSHLKEAFANTDRDVSEKCQANKRLQEENQKLKKMNKEIEQKYQNLLQRYKKDKKQWSSICGDINSLITLMQKIPPQILEQYFQ